MMRKTLSTTTLICLLACGAPDQTTTESDAVFGGGVDVGGGGPPTDLGSGDEPDQPSNTPDPEPVDVQPGPTIIVLLHGMLMNGTDLGVLSTRRSG